MKPLRPNTRLVMLALRLAAIATLMALILMVWGVLDPHPISLVIAMSVGQGLGTLAFVTFSLVVGFDLVRANVLSKRAQRFSGQPREPN